MILALQGAASGTLAGALVLACIGWISGQLGVNLLPDFHLAASQMISIALLPVIATLLAIITARRTVLRTLSRMP